MKTPIYLDHNATTRPAPEVREAVSHWLENWGNPSSVHQGGRGPKALLRHSRQEVARMIGADPLEVVFTSGGSESNNLALKGVFHRMRNTPRNHYLVSSVEHPSILKTVEYLRSLGAEVEKIAVARDGAIDLEAVEKQIRPTTALVSVMLANNETGSIFPIKKITKLAHKVGALMHTDAVQALGKMLFSVKDLDVDLASFSGHKFYALRGAGVLFCKRGVNIEPLIHGGGQERSRRAGTENLLAIASLAAMAPRLADLEAQLLQTESLRAQLESFVLHEISGATVTGKGVRRLANTSSLVIPEVDGETLLMNLDMEGFCVSTGAACSSGSQEPSPALRAMGLSRDEAQSSLRVSLGWETTAEEISAFCETLARVVKRVRGLKPDVKYHEAAL